jgi:hypothetical protein
MINQLSPFSPDAELGSAVKLDLQADGMVQTLVDVPSNDFAVFHCDWIHDEGSLSSSDILSSSMPMLELESSISLLESNETKKEGKQ